MEISLDSTFGPLLIRAGFQPGARAPGLVLYVAEIAGSREVLLTITGGGFELLTFVAPADAISYRQLETARDSRDGFVAFEFDGSWVLQRRIAARASDPAARMTGLVVGRAAELARYTDRVVARLQSAGSLAGSASTGSVDRELSLTA